MEREFDIFRPMAKREPEKETKVLAKYAEPVRRKIQELADQRLLADVCKKQLGGLNKARLSEIGTGSRPLTLYYLSKLINGGIMSLDQVLQGRKIVDLPPEDQEVMNRLELPQEDVNLLAKLRAKGIPYRNVLKALVGDDE